MTKIKMNEGLQYWTADEVAECLGYRKYVKDFDALYVKLWGFLDEAIDPTPLGGDGSNGTVEYPDGRYGLENDDKAGHWWGKLTEEEQIAINKAYEDEDSY